uniref:Uncharacterized protein n=1 Tax=Falco tinnunculus TaxID=100819 RepID=A0A8C4UDB3_FALTI
MTSPIGSENHLSKPDVREIAKAYPRIPVRGHKSSGISQTSKVDLTPVNCWREHNTSLTY